MDIKNNVLLFVPNLIAYARIVVVLVFLYYMPINYVLSVSLYSVSVFLDFVNSYAAHFFNQSTRFGAILSHMTDRVTILGLNVVLISIYPRYFFIFMLSIILDIAGHWTQTLVFPLRKKAIYNTSHPSESRILHLYHSSEPVYRAIRVTNEIFYVSICLLNFNEGPKIYLIDYSLVKLAAQIFTPFAMLKTSINVLQMSTAFIKIVKEDASKRVVILSEEVIEPQDSLDSSFDRRHEEKTTVRHRFLPKRNWDLPYDSDNTLANDKLMKSQEEAADDLFNLTGYLKELYAKTNEITKKDIENLENSSTLADRVHSRLKTSSDMLAEYTKRSCQYWVWIMQLLNIFFFFSMVMYIKVNRKPETRYVTYNKSDEL